MFSRFANPRHRIAVGARHQNADGVPLDPTRVARKRSRRGGPRTPLPLVGLVAVCAGIGLAYVGQVAHSTQATYQASQLQSEQVALRSQASRLDDQLGRLRATERIVAAAQSLGMRPPQNWAYVVSQTKPVVSRPQIQLAGSSTPGDPVQSLIATIGHAFGVGQQVNQP